MVVTANADNRGHIHVFSAVHQYDYIQFDSNVIRAFHNKDSQ